MKKKILNDIVVDGFILILGISLVVWADKVTNIVSILLGVMAILYGIIVFVNYFKKQDKLFSDTMMFTYGIVLFVMGIILIFKVEFLKELISFVIGIYITLTSAMRLHETITVSRASNVKMTPALVLSIVGIVVGLLAITLKLIFPDLIVQYIGVLLIIYSVVNMINVIMIRRK